MIKTNYDIELNKVSHNKIYKEYQSMHWEIFNQFEQQRLHTLIKKIVRNQEQTSMQEQISVLDYWCWSGNLSRHFLEHWCKVTWADVSKNFLKLYDQMLGKKYSQNIDTVLINWTDLSQFSSERYDIIGFYSVLHHIPDYLHIVNESFRILKPWWILYIDHEASEEYWMENMNYQAFLNHFKYRWKLSSFILSKLKLKIILRKLYISLRKLLNPKYQSEWDIHVFQDDHIEREEIKRIVEENNATIIEEVSYLHFKKWYNLYLYNKVKEELNDMKYIIIQKPHNA